MRTPALSTSEFEDRLQRFQDLTPRRVRRLLLVSSQYDSFLLEEDGRWSEWMLAEFPDTDLGTAPAVRHVATAKEALAALRPERFDLVLATTHLRDASPAALARAIEEARLAAPVVALAFSAEELGALRREGNLDAVERLYVWQGDFRILLAIVKSVEDRWNVRADTRRAGVSSILLIEDSVRYYSSFLPKMYAELLQQSHRVVAEGMNVSNKLARMRARPKILHCLSYEEAIRDYEEFRATLLGVVSDIDFPRGGKPHAASGLDFARMVREQDPDLPILLQTRDPSYAEKARAIGADVLLKNSPFLLQELSRFMRENFGFGDFVFRTPEGAEVARARDLRELEGALARVPDASILYHGERNHFSTWLRARTEFGLAEALKPRQISDFSSAGEIRRYLLDSIREFRRDRQSGLVSVFDPATFEPETSLAKIGGGSIGGKGRGLAFVRQLLYRYRLRNRFAGVRLSVPPGLVLATDVFDEFLDRNRLRDFAIEEPDDAAIERRFLEAPLPEAVERLLGRYLELVRDPLAVRSSSLLEDSHPLPFTGVYRTAMVGNARADLGARLADLSRAIRRVYASTFSRRAKDYLRASPFRLEEERMAVVLQRLVGAHHGPRFYPDFAGVARSHNFYPATPMRAEDGIAAVAVGLGETVVGGGRAVRFCPRYPKHPIHASNPDQVLREAQTEFFALRLEGEEAAPASPSLERFGIEAALADGTLDALASTYSPENDALYDGLGRPGVPVVTFAPILKHGLFPLAEIANLLLDLGSRALNLPCEIEFAANLSVPRGAPREFAVLQMRPAAPAAPSTAAPISEYRDEDLLCRSRRVLGNGRIEGIRDLVVVDRDRFVRSKSVEVASEVSRLNAALSAEGVPYALVGVGRWGAADPWLGIPVTWEQIAGARVIVEASLRDLEVAPSEGSHFFQNITTALVGYFTVGSKRADGFVDWSWLASLPAVEETAFVRRLRLDEPLLVEIDGLAGRGVIVKPRPAPSGEPAR